ncbi:MAG TPA: hypothetical protein VMS00_07840 [Acidimicrobiales bacterium]|nr:hypothetical protein [Acidimicrobiales bacterium]
MLFPIGSSAEKASFGGKGWQLLPKKLPKVVRRSPDGFAQEIGSDLVMRGD